MKAELGVLESDPAPETAAKLGAALAELRLDDSEREWLERRLGQLAGLPATEPGERAESFAAWRRFIEALADRRPLVLVFEDLQWADDELLDFVALAERLTGVPLLVVCTGSRTVCTASCERSSSAASCRARSPASRSPYVECARHAFQEAGDHAQARNSLAAAERSIRRRSTSGRRTIRNAAACCSSGPG